MSQLIALVACCGPKLAHPAKARLLYRSQIFRAASRIASSPKYAGWAILSAQYGVVLPDEIIAPYDLRLSHLSAEQRREWQQKCERRLRLLWPKATFVVFAGKWYAKAVENLRAEYPMAGVIKFGGYKQRLRKIANETLERGLWTP